jgi:hypothetical protein
MKNFLHIFLSALFYLKIKAIDERVAIPIKRLFPKVEKDY